jgi:hypothetical protein
MKYVGLGNRDQAFAWLEKVYDERTRPLLSMKANPKLDLLRSDPRFASLMQRITVDTARVRSDVIVRPELGGAQR